LAPHFSMEVIMNATETLNEIIKTIPAMTGYVSFYRACGVKDEEIVARLKAVVDQVAKERL